MRERGAVVSHLSASNSPILGWWLPGGDAGGDSGRAADPGLRVAPVGPLPPLPPAVACGPFRVTIPSVSVRVCACVRLGVFFPFVCFLGFYWGPRVL